MPKITPIHWKKLEKVFLNAGFRFARQEESHRFYLTFHFLIAIFAFKFKSSIQIIPLIYQSTD